MSTKRKGGGGKAKNPAQDAPERARRGTRPGSIRQLRLRLWWAIDEASTLLDAPEPELKLKAISAMSTAAGVYGNLTKTHLMESELVALQEDLNELRQTLGRPASASNRSSAPTVN